MLVVKIGGSLADSAVLSEWLFCLSEFKDQKIVIVPGGGAYAEQVRKAQKLWQFDDTVAHHMALLAMQQMALQFQGINPQLVIASNAATIKQAMLQHSTLLWSPDINWLNAAGIPAIWDITSDSLSAWLATQLQADALWLVKSVAVPENYTYQQLLEQNIVDKAFCTYIADAAYRIKFYHCNDISSLKG